MMAFTISELSLLTSGSGADGTRAEEESGYTLSGVTQINSKNVWANLSHFCTSSSAACRGQSPSLLCKGGGAKVHVSAGVRQWRFGRHHMLSHTSPVTLTAAPSCLLGDERMGSSEAQRSLSAEP